MYVPMALILANIELNRSTRLQEFPWRQMVLVVIQLRNVTTLHLVNSHNENWKKDWTGFSFHVFFTKNILYTCQNMLISQIYVVSFSSIWMCRISSIFRVTYICILSYLSTMQPNMEYVTGLKCYYHKYILLVSFCIFCCAIKRKYRHLFFDFAFYSTYQFLNSNNVCERNARRSIFVVSAMIIMGFIINEFFFGGPNGIAKI